MPLLVENNPTPVVCRPALPMDTPAVIELTRHIWEGEDYVPHVWSEWLQDPDGMLAVAERGGIVVGLGKLTKLSVSDWWFEGLRVHPDHGSQGVASHLDNYLYNYWLRTGSGFLRLATSSSRQPVIHLSNKKGFHQVGEFTNYKASTVKTADENQSHPVFQPLKEKEIDRAVKLLCDSSRDWLPFGMMDLGWQWAPPSALHLVQFVNEDQAWWWRDRQGLLIMVEKSDDTKNVARIRIAACGKMDLATFLRDVRLMAGKAGYDQITWLAPLQSDIEKLLINANFQRDWEGSLVIFEKPHPQEIEKIHAEKAFSG